MALFYIPTVKWRFSSQGIMKPDQPLTYTIYFVSFQNATFRSFSLVPFFIKAMIKYLLNTVFKLLYDCITTTHAASVFYFLIDR